MHSAHIFAIHQNELNVVRVSLMHVPSLRNPFTRVFFLFVRTTDEKKNTHRIFQLFFSDFNNFVRFLADVQCSQVRKSFARDRKCWNDYSTFTENVHSQFEHLDPTDQCWIIRKTGEKKKTLFEFKIEEHFLIRLSHWRPPFTMRVRTEIGNNPA